MIISLLSAQQSYKLIAARRYIGNCTVDESPAAEGDAIGAAGTVDWVWRCGRRFGGYWFA